MGLEDEEYLRRRRLMEEQQRAAEAKAREAVASVEPVEVPEALRKPVPAPVQERLAEGAAQPAKTAAPAEQPADSPARKGQQQLTPQEAARKQQAAVLNTPVRARNVEVTGGRSRAPVKKKPRSGAKGEAQIRDFPRKLLNAVAAYAFPEKITDITQKDALAAFVYAHYPDSTPDLVGEDEDILSLAAGVRKEDPGLSAKEQLRLIKRKLDEQTKRMETLEMLLCYLVLDRTGGIPAGVNAGKDPKQVDVRLDGVHEFSIQADAQGEAFKKDRDVHYGRVKR